MAVQPSRVSKRPSASAGVRPIAARLPQRRKPAGLETGRHLLPVGEIRFIQPVGQYSLQCPPEEVDLHPAAQGGPGSGDGEALMQSVIVATV